MNVEHRRRPIRLDASVYREAGQVFSVTIGTSPRAPVFDQQEWALECIDRLRALHRELGNSVYAYCLMPDHVHLLVASLESAPLPVFIGRWKSLCYQVRRQRGLPASFWQRGYYERALRSAEDLRAAALYILNNPVRKGLVDEFHRYPLCGSLEWDL
jgi:REP element-mobilizing transposase RayT